LWFQPSAFASDPPHNDLDAAERTHAELAIAVTAAILLLLRQDNQGERDLSRYTLSKSSS